METITRRTLPHWYVPGAAHFVTYRIFGTIPRSVFEDFQARRELLLRANRPPNLSPHEHATRVTKQIFAAYDAFLDANRDVDWLSRDDVSTVIRENLHHHRGTKYRLLSYCIMPNHVHILVQPIEKDGRATLTPAHGGGTVQSRTFIETPDARGPLSSIMHSLKNYTANRINPLIGGSGQFWQHESYDHWVRDDEELERIVAYIAMNPVRAGLVVRPEEWRWSSAHEQFALNQDASGWLVQHS